MSALAEYLASSKKSERLAALSRLLPDELDLALLRDLLIIGLDADECIELLRICQPENKIAFEYLVMEGVALWDQNVAAFALRQWVAKTDCRLWYFAVAILRSPLLSQRLRYTILEISPAFAGKQVVEIVLEAEGIEDLSPTFYGLLLKRAMQFNLEKPLLSKMARKVLASYFETDEAIENKALISSLYWVAKEEPDLILEWLPAKICISGLRWDYLDLVARNILASRRSFVSKGRFAERFATWPPEFSRERLQAADVVQLIRALLLSDCPFLGKDRWLLLSGCNKDALLGAFELLSSSDRDLITDCYSILLPEFRRVPALDDNLNALLQEQEKNFLDTGFQVDIFFFLNQVKEQLAQDLSNSDRSSFIDLAYRRNAIERNVQMLESFWPSLLATWKSPKEDGLANLANLARSAPKIYSVCYIRTLGRFKGSDAACLKLIDYIRSESEQELRELMQAFAQIGTPRALQEMLFALTRPNLNEGLALYTCQLLRGKDLSLVEHDLHGSLEDFARRRNKSNLEREVEEVLHDLWHPLQKGKEVMQEVVDGSISWRLDEDLAKKIPTFANLSAEVRRALRTAQFFHSQLGNAEARGIDFSPVIDMQYKAMELFFREFFEDECNRILSKGVLQRKLDVLGYARPIPKAMDEFESYIASLPIIADIPYFSKFKLRKMLRGICLFRPGKRFTLDGLKAFAIFFLCFSRQKCSFGFGGLFPLNFDDDRSLALFVKDLHIFQDFRNRAAHEGFRPQARQGIDEIWECTARIIAQVEQIKSTKKKFLDGSVTDPLWG